MTKFAKFISETQVKYPPKKLVEPDFICFNFSSASPEILNSRGYYEVIEDEQPTVEENEYLVPHYELCSETLKDETGELEDVSRQYIVAHWTVEEIQEEQE